VVYLKSIIAGVMALVLSYILFMMIVYVALLASVRSHGGTDFIVWRWHLSSPAFWLPVIAIFTAGFLWKFRSLSKS
jgi:hypothetical protein